MKSLVPREYIEQRIFYIRGAKVMIDRDIAELYEVETKYLNRQVKRNSERFPSEFMFQLNQKEKNELVTNWHQFESLKHTNALPYAFTENGVAMLSGILRSERAIKMSIFIIKTFVRLRELIASNNELKQKIEELEAKYDEQFQIIFDVIKQLINKEDKTRNPIGYKISQNKKI
ncbi:MAG: ORF6N domain-containing protein [Bacteroidales bacterium]|nr:ORF6N domain-containing protein [Bacteroidales bacterium]